MHGKPDRYMVVFFTYVKCMYLYTDAVWTESPSVHLWPSALIEVEIKVEEASQFTFHDLDLIST